jgi:hypothetical protein
VTDNVEERRAFLTRHGRTGGRGIYTYICTRCFHRSHDHVLGPDRLLGQGGDLQAGPYVCACGCAVPQAGPALGLTERATLEWDEMSGQS